MKKIWLKLKHAWLVIFGTEKKISKYLLDHADEGINVFVFVKKFIDSPAVEVLKAFTGDIVDKFIDDNREKVKTILTKVIDTLGLSKTCLGYENFDEKFTCFISVLREFTPDVQNALVYKGASLYTRFAAEKPIKESLADTAVTFKMAERKIDSGSWTAAA